MQLLPLTIRIITSSIHALLQNFIFFQSIDKTEKIILQSASLQMSF